MTTIRELTQDQFNHICDEFNAPSHRRTRLTREEVVQIAETLNRKINIPIISEKREEKILIRLVLRIDRFMYDNLPNEIYDLIRSLDRGIDDTEAKRIIVRLAHIANRYINIPYIPEKAEYVAIRCVLGVIINAARKNWDFTRSVQTFNEINIPSSEQANKQEIEALICEPAMC